MGNLFIATLLTNAYEHPVKHVISITIRTIAPSSFRELVIAQICDMRSQVLRASSECVKKWLAAVMQF